MGNIGRLARKAFRRVSSRLYLDLNGDYRSTVMVSGMGRSGTTWIADMINCDGSYRDIFEPFVPFEVPEARGFRYHAYLRPDDDERALVQAAGRIFSGRVRCHWTDRRNTKRWVRRRIVKDVRTNLMLKWVRAHFPGMPIVLVLRHPCAVVNSWLRLKWGRWARDPGQPTDLDACLSQAALRADFLEPFLGDIRAARDDFERILYLWCILTYVPLRQFRQGEIFVAFYERFCMSPGSEVGRLFAFLGRAFDPCVERIARRPSSESDSGSAIVKGTDVLESWRQHIAADQVEAAVRILRRFGLDALYTDAALPVASLDLPLPEARP